MNRDELVKTANSRLYPSLRDPNYLVLRSRRKIFAQFMQKLPKNLMVLDVGGRYQPYRPLLDGKFKSYVAIDLEPTEFVTAVGSGENIPLRDAIFDVVIATSVFECFAQPHQAAKEVHRVLKPGGVLFVSVAGAAPRFMEEERWRYMPLGLRTVFGQFSEILVVPEVSSLGGFCRLINLGLRDCLRLRPLQSAYEATLCPVINAISLLLECAQLTSNDNWAGNYTVVAVK